MNEFISVEILIVVLIGTMCLLGAFGVFARWCSFSPAVRREQLEKLCLGMTSAEVVALIGQPRQTKETRAGVREWVFGSRLKRHVLIMHFNAHDRLTTFAHGVPGKDQRRNPFPDA